MLSLLQTGADGPPAAGGVKGLVVAVECRCGSSCFGIVEQRAGRGRDASYVVVRVRLAEGFDDGEVGTDALAGAVELELLKGGFAGLIVLDGDFFGGSHGGVFD